MADGSRIRVSIIAEGSYGVTPTPTPTFLVLPVTGSALNDRLGYVQSNVINPDRNVDDLVRLSKSAGGNIPLEFRFSPAGEGLSTAILALLSASAYTASANETGCTIPGGTKTITKAAFNFATNFAVGDIVKVSGSSVTAENGYYRVTASTTGTLTVDAPANFTAGGSSVTVTRGARAVNGTATPSFTIEVAHLDLQKAQIYTGCVINTMDVNVAIGSLATLTFGIEAQSSTRADNNTGTTDQFISGATYTAAATHPTLDPIGVQEIRVGGADYAAQSLALSLTNNARPREQIGSLGPVSMARGFFGATGQVTAYLADWTDHNAFAGNTPTDLWFAAIDANGRGWSLSLPQVKFSDLNSPVQGNNTDVFKNISVTAYKDPTEACTVRVQRWD
jgi:hypothetical protein